MTPSGPLGKALDALATLLSTNVAYQTMVGAANPAEALATIHYALAARPERPLTVLWVTPAWSYESDQQGVQSAGILQGIYQPRSAVYMRTEVPIDDLTTDQDAAIGYINAIGAVFEELVSAARGTDLQITTIASSDIPRLYNPAEDRSEGRYVWQEFAVGYWGKF